MPRPVKARRVCGFPDTLQFGPKPEYVEREESKPVVLSVDEYEVIRLIDYEGLNQQEASKQMNIARTTVQSIYSQGRKKLAQMLVESRELLISGGNFRLCNGQGRCIHRRCCQTDHMMDNEAKTLDQLSTAAIKDDTGKYGEKEKVNNMKIVIPVDRAEKNAKISETFGRTNFYLIYDEADDLYEFIENPASQSPGSAGVKAAQIIVDTGSKILLTPRCGMKAGKVLAAAEFKIYQTEGDDLQENLKKYKNGDLSLLKEMTPGKHGGK